MRGSILILLLLLLWATPALAVDGVLEINQTCAVQTGCFAGDAAGFPVTIDGSAGRSFRLTSDLTVPDENTTGIVISASSSSIDLNGFEIVRSGCQGVIVTNCTPTTGSGWGVAFGSPYIRGLSVKNGSITGMGSYGIELGNQSEVTNLRIRWNRLGGILVNSGSNVTGNSVMTNGGRGIWANHGSTVSGNTAFDNGNDGIKGGEGCTIVGNTAFNNGDTTDPTTDDGIECGSGCIVRGNSVRSNRGYGLNLGGDSAYSENVVTNNTTGTVTGVGSANNLGDNYCAGTGVTLPTCP
jgi:parallel beta-helix repeat protein